MKTSGEPCHIDLQALASLLMEHDDFAVIAHMRPDGDALGSTIAMGEALRCLGKKVTLYNEDSVPDNLTFLSGSDQILPIPNTPVSAQTGIALDNGSWKRIGDRAVEAMKTVPFWFNIDHHGTNDCYGDVCCIMPEECSTGSLLYKLFKLMGVTFTPAMRDALYIAISTDTGSFQYERTSAEVMEIAADLIRMGVNVHEINKSLYQEVSWNKIMLIRELLNGIQFTPDRSIAYFCLTQAAKAALHANPSDTEGLIDFVRSIQGTTIAAIFEEIDDGRIRISLRSKDTQQPVDSIARQFGGGGHALASGIRMKCTLQEAVDTILTSLAKSQ